MTMLRDPDVIAIADELRRDGVYLMAIDLYAWLLDHDDTADAHFGIGQSYGKLGDYQAALRHLDVAFERDPERAIGAGYYAYILERAGRMAEAGQWYERALRGAERDDLWTRSHHAWFLEKDGRFDAARRAFEVILKDSPTHTWSSKRYALLLRRMGNEESARQVLRRAMSDAPNSVYAKLNYLEYLLVTESADYERFRVCFGDPVRPEWLPVLLELFDHYRWQLSTGRPDAERLARWTESADELPSGVHRDFDDLTALLARRGGDVAAWQDQLARLRR